jgi:hypothetical protein
VIEPTSTLLTTDVAADVRYTTDHDTIQVVASRHDVLPAVVRGTGTGDDLGVLRLVASDIVACDEGLTAVPWDRWLAKFDRTRSALLYVDGLVDGLTFFKLVAREE